MTLHGPVHCAYCSDQIHTIALPYAGPRARERRIDEDPLAPTLIVPAAVQSCSAKDLVSICKPHNHEPDLTSAGLA